SVSFVCASINSALHYALKERHKPKRILLSVSSIAVLGALLSLLFISNLFAPDSISSSTSAYLVSVQPNVPMSGLSEERLIDLRGRQIEAAESAIGRHKSLSWTGDSPTIVVLPESPMNFEW